MPAFLPARETEGRVAMHENVRTLAYYHYVGVVQALGQVTKAAERKQRIFTHRTVIRSKHNIEVGFEFAVLVGVIQHYKLGAVFCQGLAARHPVFAHRRHHGREFALDLQGLVPEHCCGAVIEHFLEAFAAAFIAPRQQGDVA